MHGDFRVCSEVYCSRRQANVIHTFLDIRIVVKHLAHNTRTQRGVFIRHFLKRRFRSHKDHINYLYIVHTFPFRKMFSTYKDNGFIEILHPNYKKYLNCGINQCSCLMPQAGVYLPSTMSAYFGEWSETCSTPFQSIVS